MGTSISAIAIALSMITAAAAGIGTTSGDVATIIAKTKSLYENTSSGTVEFVQTDPGGNTSGTLWFSGDDRFRLEYPKQTIVNNGSEVWRYVPSRQQAVVSTASRRAGQITPGEILTMFPGDYNTSLIGSEVVNGRDVWVVRARAGGSSRIGDVGEARLYINKSNYRFEQITINSDAGGEMTIRVTSAKYNASIPGSRFNFTPPQGVRVIDLRK